MAFTFTYKFALSRIWIPAFAGMTAVLLMLSFPAIAAQYFTAIDDLPVMQGMTEQPGAVVFDTPGGRILEAVGATAQSRAAVLAFYRQSLPPLGWRETVEGVFLRGGEKLALTFAPGRVHFHLSPAE